MPICYLSLCRRVSPPLHAPTGLWEQESLRAHFDRRPWMKDRYCREHEVAVRDLEAKLDEQDRHAEILDGQALGYVGKLTFDEQYRGERDRLRERWARRASEIPWHVPPVCPPITYVEQLPEDLIDADDVVGPDPLAGEMAAFLRRWGLGFLKTWDLPVPQGPLGGLPAKLVVQLRGPEAIVDHYPDHYDLPSDTDLREQVRSRQEREGCEAGIAIPLPVTDASGRSRPRSKGPAGGTQGRPSSPAPRGSEYAPARLATSFRMYLLERAVRDRFDDPPRGLVVRLLEGCGHFFDVDPDSLAQYRKRYQRFF
ncbi:hypothetical protein BH23PLA1_BH23PLA1_35420 [soil metagenome]